MNKSVNKLCVCFSLKMIEHQEAHTHIYTPGMALVCKVYTLVRFFIHLLLDSILHFNWRARYLFMKMTTGKFHFRSKAFGKQKFLSFFLSRTINRCKMLISFCTQISCKIRFNMHINTNSCWGWRLRWVDFDANGFSIYCQNFINPIGPTRKIIHAKRSHTHKLANGRAPISNSK